MKWKITKALPGGSKWGRNGAKMLIIENFTTVIPYIRCKLDKIVTDIPGQCEMKNSLWGIRIFHWKIGEMENIRYLGNQALPGG